MFFSKYVYVVGHLISKILRNLIVHYFHLLHIAYVLKHPFLEINPS